MALSILDGNQSATTLSTILSSGQHITAHTVVSLGTQAITDITSAVSGTSVCVGSISISGTPSVTGSVSVLNFPASQSTTFGAVTGSVSVLNFPASQSVTFGATTGSISVLNFPASQAVTFGLAIVSASNITGLNNSVGTDGNTPTSTNFVKIGGHQDGSNQVEHIVHVSAGGSMKVDASDSTVTFGVIRGTVTVGNSLTISSLPAISGTVTANIGLNVAQSLTGGASETMPPAAVRIGWGSEEEFNGVGVDNGGLPLPIQIYLGNTSDNRVTTASPLPISGTVTVGNTVTIAGTVTANPTGTQTIAGTVTANVFGTNSINQIPLNMTVQGDGFANGNRLAVSIIDDQGAEYGTSSPLIVSGTVTIGSAIPAGTNRIGVVTIGAGTVTIGAGTAQIGSVTASISGTVPISISSVTVGNSVTIASLPAISGTVTANSSNGSLTTRFGSVTTANTAFATSAVTNANRKYLLIQNVTTASNVITVGIGFTPTTTQGIQLSSGAGLTFEGSYIPTGAVNLLSSVTASCFTILEA